MDPLARAEDHYYVEFVIHEEAVRWAYDKLPPPKGHLDTLLLIAMGDGYAIDPKLSNWDILVLANKQWARPAGRDN